jgi:hypothetical protein
VREGEKSRQKINLIIFGRSPFLKNKPLSHAMGEGLGVRAEKGG